MNIGLAIKIARIEHDINQSQLANQLGYTTAYISLIENNKRIIPIITFIDIATLLGLNPSELMRRAEQYLDPEEEQ